MYAVVTKLYDLLNLKFKIKMELDFKILNAFMYLFFKYCIQ